MLSRLTAAEEGVGIVTALMVVFIVFALGASWYAISVHELDEVTFDRHRTSAVHVADAGVRQAMYELNRTELQSLPFWTGSGDTGGVCNLTQVTTRIDGTDEQLGVYWLRVSDVTPADTEDGRYFIESWGWAPDPAARQAVARKVEQEVNIVVRRGFVYGLFASSGGLAAGNSKTIYGDVYSGKDVLLANSTEILDNGAFPGDGHFNIYGSLTVDAGSNLFVQGDTTVNGAIDDQHAGDTFGGDVISVNSDAYFAMANIGGTVRLGGVLLPGSNVSGAPVVENATGLTPVEQDTLPDYDWATAKLGYSNPQEWATWADFINNYYTPNKTNLSGQHYVRDSGSYVWTMRRAEFVEDFVLVVDGQIELEAPSAPDPDAVPVWVTVVGNQPTSKITVGRNFKSTEELRFLLYSKGAFASDSLSEVYGVVYGTTDTSTNNLTVYYRPPKSEIGFTFTDLPQVDTEPLVWREVPAAGLPCDLP